MKRYLFQVLVLALLICLLIPVQAAAQGWGEQQPLQFKLNRAGNAQYNESLRLGFNRDLGGLNSSNSGGSGSDSHFQDLRNLNNVIEITETYEIVLNGNNNNVSTKGLVLNGDQDSATTTQDGSNKVSANNSTKNNNVLEPAK
jgi:hypothetical protein